MTTKPMIWIIVFFILLASALAVQPQISVPQYPTALTIVYPKVECLKLGGTYINFDVLDSNYSKLSNTTATCAHYIQDQSGSLILSGNPIYDSSVKFWYFYINDTTITTPGDYSFYIYCNKSKEENGFVSVDWQMTNLGVCAPDDKSPLSAIILMPLIFGILIMIASFVLDDDHKVLKIGLFVFSYLTIFISLWFAISTLGRYYGFQDMQNNIGTITWVFGVMFFVILSYFLIYAFIMGINAAAQKKREKLGW